MNEAEGRHDDEADDEEMRLPCPACPDGNEWGMNGPTGRACKVCGGNAYIVPRTREPQR